MGVYETLFKFVAATGCYFGPLPAESFDGDGEILKRSLG